MHLSKTIRGKESLPKTGIKDKKVYIIYPKGILITNPREKTQVKRKHFTFHGFKQKREQD